jgi:hypothetical protein
MINIKIDDKQIMDFAKKSPKRARWASAEALKMCGGHYRKKLRAYIEQGGENWPPLSPTTIKIKERQGLRHLTPLYGLGKYSRFRYGVRKGIQRVTLGFLTPKIARIIRICEVGRRRKVTPALRKFYHVMGVHLKKSTKYINIPARPIIKPFWKKHEKGVQIYIEKRFFEKFFSKEKSRIKI